LQGGGQNGRKYQNSITDEADAGFSQNRVAISFLRQASTRRMPDFALPHIGAVARQTGSQSALTRAGCELIL